MDDGVYEVVEPKKRDLVLRMYDWGRDSVQGIGEFAKGLVVGSIVPYMIPTAIRVGNQPLYTDPDTNEVPGIIIGTVGSFFLTGALIVNYGNEYPALAAAPLVTNAISGLSEAARYKRTLDDRVEE